MRGEVSHRIHLNLLFLLLHPLRMPDAGTISSFLEKKLSSLKRDGVSAVEAARWLVAENILSGETQPLKHLRTLLRAGKIKGAYQFPNKRWVIINRPRLPDGIQRVVPIKEAAVNLRVSEASLRNAVAEGTLKTLNFGSALLLFLEDDLKRYHSDHIERSFRLMFPEDKKQKKTEVNRLKRQLYYLRSDVRLIAERIEELIRLLE
ncbi:MAG: hypothetical protein GTO51_07815 [Candidatus Latescibacteria bacterium]|nr:hypothetical protein [Candidatus Latescibacterota bacterium]NIM21739.1 hypothetical protein [Candidatus Latescibacterota bacterium]NIM65877.1 hypothetical protein [Candidatus Latescibacterota bacterium]NIO02622.1 hypothetical protein [Candidatus Latescibacterota bacterium]NIO29603.1 hypothetical protein [Candidatus Latescibacterota bacterium]